MPSRERCWSPRTVTEIAHRQQRPVTSPAATNCTSFTLLRWGTNLPLVPHRQRNRPTPSPPPDRRRRARTRPAHSIDADRATLGWRRRPHCGRGPPARAANGPAAHAGHAVLQPAPTLLASLRSASSRTCVARNYLLDQRTSAAKIQAFANAERRSATSCTPRRPNVGELVIEQLRTEGDGLRRPDHAGRRASRSVRQLHPGSASPPAGAASTQVGSGSDGLQRFDVGGRPVPRRRRVHRRVRRARTSRRSRCEDTERTLREIAHGARHRRGGRPRCSPAFVGLVDQPPPAAPAHPRRRRCRRHRVGRPRHAHAAGDRPRPRTPRQLVQRHGRRGAGTGSSARRGSRPTSATSCAHRSPRSSAAVEVLDGRRSRPARPQPAGARRGRRPGAPVRPDGDGPARAVAHRRRVDRAAPRGRRPRGADPRASRTGTGSATSPIEISPTVPATVQLDKLRFERILANLLENAQPARRRSDAGRRRAVRPTRHRARRGGRRTRRRARRAGTDLRAVRPRQRGAAQRSGPDSASSLVAEHAQAHGGEAWVEDRPGGGARFVVSFGDGATDARVACGARGAVLAVALVIGAAACGVPDSSDFEPIDPARRAVRARRAARPRRPRRRPSSRRPPSPQQTSTTAAQDDDVDDRPAEPVQLYFPQRQPPACRSPRSATAPATASQVIAAPARRAASRRRAARR